MLPGRVKLQFAAFFLLSGAVAANLFLQPFLRAPADAAPDDARLAGAQLMSFGDTGSITPGETGPSQSPAARGSVAERTTAGSAALPAGAVDVTRAVQRELRIRGYETGGVDGEPGLMTRAAIMGFEYDHGLALSGRPTQQLLKRIVLGDGSRAARGPRPGGQTAEASEVIRTVQTSLSKLGYRPGRANGKLTSETMRAIREFEADQALPETGRVSGPLVARLGRISGEGRVAAGL